MFFGLLIAMSVVLSGAADAHASSGMHVPKVEKITQVTRTSVVVPFKIRRFAGETVTAWVFVKNDNNSDDQMEKMYTVKLDDLGDGSVDVKGLMPGTPYEFKVRVNDTSSSDPRGGMTAG